MLPRLRLLVLGPLLGACTPDKDPQSPDSDDPPITTTAPADTTVEPTGDPLTTTTTTATGPVDPSTTSTTGPPPDTTSGDTTDPTTTADATTSAAPGLAADIVPIFSASCVIGCHTRGGSSADTGVILTPEDAYASLVGVMSPSVPGLALVEPGDLAGSYLWHKLKDTYQEVGGVGLKMPLGSTLPPDDLETIEQWIVGGALP